MGYTISKAGSKVFIMSRLYKSTAKRENSLKYLVMLNDFVSFTVMVQTIHVIQFEMINVPVWLDRVKISLTK